MLAFLSIYLSLYIQTFKNFQNSFKKQTHCIQASNL